jgi:hypothetical protein
MEKPLAPADFLHMTIISKAVITYPGSGCPSPGARSQAAIASLVHLAAPSALLPHDNSYC